MYSSKKKQGAVQKWHGYTSIRAFEKHLRPFPDCTLEFPGDSQTLKTKDCLFRSTGRNGKLGSGNKNQSHTLASVLPNMQHVSCS